MWSRQVWTRSAQRLMVPNSTRSLSTALVNCRRAVVRSTPSMTSSFSILTRPHTNVLPLVHQGPTPTTVSWLGLAVAGTIGAATVLTLESQTAHAAGKDDKDNAEDVVRRVQAAIKEFAETNVAKLQGAWPSGMQDVQQSVQAFINSGKPSQISFGFIMGVCSGFAMRKASKLGALTLGSIFILFQAASYTGYIDVNYQKIERDVMKLLDVNKDGQVDAKDVDDVYKRVMKVLEFSLPAGSGFAVGFAVGFRAG